VPITLSNQKSSKKSRKTKKSSAKKSKPNLVSSSKKTQKKSKTSNLTPQKGSDDEQPQNNDNLSITLTKDKSSISVRRAPSKKSVGSKLLNAISPIKTTVQESVKSRKKPQSLKKSIDKSENNQGLLSMDKS
jgi:hypothetical protein